jgi:dihydrofolate synthase / folylpolyglutamate synthase
MEVDATHDWLWLAARRRSGRTRDPRVARALLDALAIPDPPAVVHVVGTNGKGSVATALAAMAQAAGLACGCFVSPHVEDYAERIAVDGQPISAAEVRAFTARARRLVDEGESAAHAAGFFEWTLALALDAYARHGVQLAVLEAGVGARRDATLAVGNVIASVVTRIDLDHLETLGPDLEAIAMDKAAAARPGVPLITAADGVGLEVLRREAQRLGTPLLHADAGAPLARLPYGVRAMGAAARWPATRFENLRIACAVARTLRWPETALVSGARAPAPPARFERFEWGGVQVILDGAHDPSAARRLAPDLPPGTVLVFGALARKQGAATLAALTPHVARVIVTSPDPDEAASPWPADARCDDPEAALQTALTWAGPGGTVAVAGSLYLAGRLRPVLRHAAAATVAR